MNSISVNLYDYCSKLVNLHNVIWIDINHFFNGVLTYGICF